MQQTTNYALKKIELADSPPDITIINPNWDTIDQKMKELEESDAAHLADDTSHVRYGTATGTNAKSIALNPAPVSLSEGMALSFKNATQNSGTVTLNVNGLGAKSVLKANGTALASGNLKANSIYTVRYNGTAFILQGEGGEYGNATAVDVLSGKSVGTENGIIMGSMPNNGQQIFTPSDVLQWIPYGFHNSSYIQPIPTSTYKRKYTTVLYQRNQEVILTLPFRYHMVSAFMFNADEGARILIYDPAKFRWIGYGGGNYSPSLDRIDDTQVRVFTSRNNNGLFITAYEM